MLELYLIFHSSIVKKMLTLSHRCDQYVRYEGAMTAIGIEIVGVMMLLRFLSS